MPKPRFDSITRYRVAALLLLTPLLLYVFSDERPSLVGPALYVYLMGTLLIIFNLGVEGWKIYQGRREVQRMLHKASQSSQKR